MILVDTVQGLSSQYVFTFGVSQILIMKTRLAAAAASGLEKNVSAQHLREEPQPSNVNVSWAAVQKWEPFIRKTTVRHTC